MAYLYLFVTPWLVLAALSPTSAAEECIRDYHELEASLVGNPLNLDSLTRSFFPPNEPSVPVVEALYTLSDSRDPEEHPLVLETQGANESELNALVHYRYRWSDTPIYLFMDPEVLELLALFTIRLRYHAVRVVVRPICDNYTRDKVPLPEYFLNQMTTRLKIYAITRKKAVEEGLETDISNLQGYASFFEFNKDDFFVIGYNTNYKANMFLLIIGLIALATFITMATPLILNAHYEILYTRAKKKQSNALFVIWAGVIVYTTATVLVLIVDINFLFVQRLRESVPAVWPYYLGIVSLIAFLIFDFVLSIFVKKEKDFPLPYVILCCSPCNKNTVPIQTVAIWLGIVFMQLVAFHMTFIFLAFVASPVQTGSTVLLFITGILCAIIIVTLFLDAFQKRDVRQKLLYLVLFICVLIFTILFATCFIRITIYVGDIQSGGIPSLFASLAPSALLAGISVFVKKVLDIKVSKDTARTEHGDVETVPQPSIPTNSEQTKHSEQTSRRESVAYAKTECGTSSMSSIAATSGKTSHPEHTYKEEKL